MPEILPFANPDPLPREFDITSYNDYILPLINYNSLLDFLE